MSSFERQRYDTNTNGNIANNINSNCVRSPGSNATGYRWRWVRVRARARAPTNMIARTKATNWLTFIRRPNGKTQLICASRNKSICLFCARSLSSGADFCGNLSSSLARPLALPVRRQQVAARPEAQTRRRRQTNARRRTMALGTDDTHLSPAALPCARRRLTNGAVGLACAARKPLTSARRVAIQFRATFCFVLFGCVVAVAAAAA